MSHGGLAIPDTRDGGGAWSFSFRARPAGAQSNFSKLGSQRPIKSPTRVKRGREVRVEFVGMTPKFFVFNHHFSVVWFRSTVLKINHRDPPTGTQLC
jgi:hypothetical protein